MMKMNALRFISLLSLLLFVSSNGYAEDRKPNFVFILVDDQGWNGLSVAADPDIPQSRSNYYETPNTDKLAKAGMRFSQAYSPAPICMPSRHAIQYGKTSYRTGVKKNFAGKYLNVTYEESMVNTLKKVAPEYTAAHYGKWHLKVEPEKLGFDDSDGLTTNNEGSDSKDPLDRKRTQEISGKGVSFMEACVGNDKPFFLQLSYYANHRTFLAAPETAAKYRAKEKGEFQNNPNFAAMNEELDRGVGNVLDAIDRLGIRENTYVIYTADNGFQEAEGKQKYFGKARPLYTAKGFVNEGGLRVPFIVRGPGIAANSFSRVPVIGYDIFPTILDIVGSYEAVPSKVEGGSFYSVLKDGGMGKIERSDDFLYFYGGWIKQSALIQGDYKLVKCHEQNALELFHLKNDIGEQKNLAAELPEVVERLDATLSAYQQVADRELKEANKRGKAEAAKRRANQKQNVEGAKQ